MDKILVHLASAFAACLVHAVMKQAALGRQPVLRPRFLKMDESALPPTEDEVLHG